MRTVTPKESFTGYPNGKRTDFTAGVPVPVPSEYADMLESKGLIPAKKAKKDTPDTE